MFGEQGHLTSQPECGVCMGIRFTLNRIWRWEGVAVVMQASSWGLSHHRGPRVAWTACGGHGQDLSMPACGSPPNPPPGASTVVSRKEWGLRFLTRRAQLTRPVACVIMDQLTEVECQEQNVCSWKLRGLQSRSVYNTGWCDVAYM